MSNGVKELVSAIRRYQKDLGRTEAEIDGYVANYLTTFFDGYYNVNTHFAEVVDTRLRSVKRLQKLSEGN